IPALLTEDVQYAVVVAASSGRDAVRDLSREDYAWLSSVLDNVQEDERRFIGGYLTARHLALVVRVSHGQKDAHLVLRSLLDRYADKAQTTTFTVGASTA